MKLQLFVSVAFTLLSAVPGALCEPTVDDFALSSEDVTSHYSPEGVLVDSEDIDPYYNSEDGPDDFGDADDSNSSSGDVSAFEEEAQSRRIVSCRGLGIRDCRNQSFCSWDRADRVCLQRSSGGSSGDRCTGRRRSSCNSLRDTCWYDIRIKDCVSRRGFKNRCNGLRRRQCERTSGCNFIKRGSAGRCAPVTDRVNDDQFGNDDRYTDLIGEDLIEDA
mmetsp:Transcript_8934/g.16143  ORF Transcript_8934/g.16143 Transcript_8934/m.16143 type:complete len:219 (+) Transcript_8934:236-892(+)